MPAWKMFRQQITGLLHTMDDSWCKFGFAEIPAQRVHQFSPEFIAAFFMDTGVADDGKFMRARGDKNQHAVPFGRFVHAQAHEFNLGRRERVFDVVGADADADFSGRLVLGIANGSNNFIVLHMPGEMFWVHNFTSLLRRRRRQNSRHHRKIHHRRRNRRHQSNRRPTNRFLNKRTHRFDMT